MTVWRESDIAVRVGRFELRQGIRRIQQLGFGKDGIVWATDRASVIKAHGRVHTYEAEREVYRRLSRHNVDEIDGHAVPRLLDTDDACFIIEMTIVQPPFILDFASAVLDEPPDFPPEVLDQWTADKREAFDQDIAHLERILRTLRRAHGIYMMDVHPDNIRFR